MHASCPVWYDQTRYRRTKTLDFEGWRTQIGNRVFLQGLLSSGQSDQFDLHFSEIQSTPFMDLGFADSYRSENAVYPLTFGVAEAIISALSASTPNRTDSCDLRLLEHEDQGFGMHAHFTIDLNASETEIIRDFKALLTATLSENRIRYPRERSPGISLSVIGSWAEFGILPYQDLLLWHRRQNAIMPSDTDVADWLFPDGDGDKDKAKSTREKAQLVFSLNTLRQLAIVSP